MKNIYEYRHSKLKLSRQLRSLISRVTGGEFVIYKSDFVKYIALPTFVSERVQITNSLLHIIRAFPKDR